MEESVSEQASPISVSRMNADLSWQLFKERTLSQRQLALNFFKSRQKRKMLETPHGSDDVDKTMKMMIDPKA